MEKLEKVSSEPGPITDRAETAAIRLLEYCRQRNWSGFDPYDSLNSRLFQKMPFLNSRWPRIIMTQAMKRSPINLRSLLLVEPSQNPKGLSLFLQALIKLRALGLAKDADIQYLAERIAALRSPGTEFYCWGYSFPWQTRTVLVPRGAPNLVCTCFVASALLDLHESEGESRWLEMAASAAEYIRAQLFWKKGDQAGFRYPMPTSETPIHNANFLAAALLARVYRLTGEAALLEPALAATEYSLSKQQPDGSWFYGEAQTQKWIDNFHTGFNLTALRSMGKSLESDQFDRAIEGGFRFYRQHFLGEKGRPKYFHNRPDPVDAHCVSQTILTLVENIDLEPRSLGEAGEVIDWALKNFVSREGYFYHQKTKWFTNKTPYMRWGQAWMLLALSSYLELVCSSNKCPGQDQQMVVA
jgi:rhamnogalacturonyl hydrolase YesR